jgi:hypothetical protein
MGSSSRWRGLARAPGPLVLSWVAVLGHLCGRGAGWWALSGRRRYARRRPTRAGRELRAAAAGARQVVPRGVLPCDWALSPPWGWFRGAACGAGGAPERPQRSADGRRRSQLGRPAQSSGSRWSPGLAEPAGSPPAGCRPPAFLGLGKGGLGAAVWSGAAGTRWAAPGRRVRPYGGLGRQRTNASPPHSARPRHCPPPGPGGRRPRRALVPLPSPSTAPQTGGRRSWRWATLASTRSRGG